MKKQSGKIISFILAISFCVSCLFPYAYASDQGNSDLLYVNTEDGIGFSDIEKGSKYYDDIQYVSSNDIMDGTSEDSFSPEQPITVAMLVEALYQMNGTPLMLENSAITDISEASWHEDAFAWAKAYQIIDDFGLSDASADDTVNREQLAVTLHNYAEHNDVDFGDTTTYDTGRDSSDICEYAADDMAWAISTDLIEKHWWNKCDPHDIVSRGELAAALANYQQANFETVGVVANGLTLICPSEEQYTICPLRDFYVVGDIDDDIVVPDNAELAVTVTAKDGTLMRKVYTDIKDNTAGMWVDYPNIVIYGDKDAFKSSLMPDLVYDPENPDSFKDTWIKAYYTDEHYTCVIYGGSYKQDINPVDQFGNTLTSLPEGDYDLSVMLTDSEKTLASLNVQITIGVTAKKVLSRFSPELHLEKVESYADENGYTVFLDPFPGYWNTTTFFPDWGISYEAEIEKRWALADREEYIGGMSYFFDYNISTTSTSYRIEIGQLAADKVLDDPNSITYCYYDIGEPQIVQRGKTYEGKFVQKNVSQMTPLVFTRIDLWNASAAENYITPQILSSSQSKFDLSTSFNLEPGEVFWLNGLCKAIQPETVTFNPETESYTMGNRIAAIRYTFKLADNGITKYTFDKEVPGLTRVFENGYSSVSTLEFRHKFSVDESVRGYDFYVTAQALDVSGNLIGSPNYVCSFTVPLYD